MPVTLFSLAPRGSATDRGTDRMAAWWKMTVAPAAARSTVARSRMSPSMISRVAACREAKGNRAREPGGEVVEDAHPGAIPEEALDEMRSDESCTAGDQGHDLHRANYTSEPARP